MTRSQLPWLTVTVPPSDALGGIVSLVRKCVGCFGLAQLILELCYWYDVVLGRDFDGKRVGGCPLK